MNHPWAPGGHACEGMKRFRRSQKVPNTSRTEVCRGFQKVTQSLKKHPGDLVIFPCLFLLFCDFPLIFLSFFLSRRMCEVQGCHWTCTKFARAAALASAPRVGVPVLSHSWVSHGAFSKKLWKSMKKKKYFWSRDISSKSLELISGTKRKTGNKLEPDRK